MARPPRKKIGILNTPLTVSRQFLPATILLVIGLILLGLQYGTQVVQNPKDLTAIEGTLSNYSFKKTEKGDLDYGIWLQELTERFVLPKHEIARFDTAAFKAQAKIGERLRVEYNAKEDPVKNEGNRRIYSLSAPKINKSFLTAEDVLRRDSGGWLTWLTYALIAAGVGLFAWKIYQQNQQHDASY
ncbi:hypothetical protein TH61_08825 [Rufibacter sp. DG15C]|uniref:hypothetical protein n=1 Tax=Rufibacter sp. DG15C TaxID=1379909 RepID=UPI00078D60B6|nr:hypothetical protein [Rufibacter sp. DG15C]AMM51256.1 hypothetical protein TH61_08825 [Rufibacter sp. DG15C]